MHPARLLIPLSGFVLSALPGWGTSVSVQRVGPDVTDLPSSVFYIAGPGEAGTLASALAPFLVSVSSTARSAPQTSVMPIAETSNPAPAVAPATVPQLTSAALAATSVADAVSMIPELPPSAVAAPAAVGDPTPVPEPSTLGLIALSCAGLLAHRAIRRV